MVETDFFLSLSVALCGSVKAPQVWIPGIQQISLLGLELKCESVCSYHCKCKLSEAKRKRTHHVKWKLVYWCCVYQQMFLWFGRCENMIFFALRHVAFRTEHAVTLGKKKGSTSVWLRTVHRSASHLYTTLCSRLTQVLVIGTAHCLTDRWGVRVADPHAVCVFTWSVVVPSQRHTARVRDSSSSVHLVPTWFVCCLFIQQKRRPSYST